MDKELLFKERLPEDDVELPGVGTVRVRGLNRDEAMSVGKIDDPAMKDRHIIAIGMVDPRMSVSDVARWGKASVAGELEKVSRRIGELSGLLEGADKAAYKSAGDGSDAGVRTLPGAEAGDDGGPAPGGDE